MSAIDAACREFRVWDVDTMYESQGDVVRAKTPGEAAATWVQIRDEEEMVEDGQWCQVQVRDSDGVLRQYDVVADVRISYLAREDNRVDVQDALARRKEGV